MRGYVSPSEKRYGTVKFSNVNTINIKENDGPVSVALYGANGYEKYIQETLPDSSIRLITLSELEQLGCLDTSCSSAPSWVYNTSYWTGTVASTDGSFVRIVYSNGVCGSNSFSVYSNYGVRPVITIPKN